ncbi:RDD family protein [Microbacterium esteraromaticum]|uniref:RDD family protein n=1 Tax=Microbacterium esteraromaticum TaxID=57043 RepID=UPI0019587ED4|nr:RDD family protein [Microbacterium esteraromaticum]MBM7466465.1 putative RDD family membrane protein YckC [Microbacterium esteraromaticum]
MIWEIDDKSETIEGLDESGRPDPAYAAALGLLPAPLGRRALAAVYDGAAWMLVQLPFLIGSVPLLMKLAGGSISAYGLVNHPGFTLAVVMASITALLSLALAIVQWSLHAVKGMTIGKALTRIRTVNVRTLGKAGFLRLLLRYLIVGAAGLLPAIGSALFLLSPVFDPERRGRGWHDKASGVWLVDVRAGLNPFDEKRMRVARKMVKAEPTRERVVLPSLATPVDPSQQPAYRPGSRVSAGVLGVARPHDANERPVIGLPVAAGPEPEPQGEAGKPVLGGYRAPAKPEEPASGSSAPPPAATPPAVGAAGPGAPVVDAVPRQRREARTVAVERQRETPAAAAPVAPAAAPETAAPAAAPEAAAPAAAAPAPAPEAAAPVRFGLRFDTGEGIGVTAPVLLGRNPDASGHPGATPMPLADSTRSLSKTHLLARPVDGGIEVVDLGSTNGSGLIRGGAEYALSAGAATLVTEGDTIRLGDRIAAVVRV